MSRGPEWSTGENRDSERVRAILDALDEAYPDAHLILDYENPFQLLCATILAARATDEKVNEVTPELFRRWPTPAALAGADREELEELVHPTGFYRQKAGRLLDASRHLVDRFDGEVPTSVDELTELPGVGKKTAIMVINHGHGIPAGIAVDTHVQRVSRRLDLSQMKTADAMEKDLRDVVPEERWIGYQDLLAFHGRARCRAPEPSCTGCPVDRYCYFPNKVYD